MVNEYKKLIESAWEDRNLINFKEYRIAIESVIQHLDKGEIRVAEQIGERWHVNDWVKKGALPSDRVRSVVRIAQAATK